MDVLTATAPASAQVELSSRACSASSFPAVIAPVSLMNAWVFSSLTILIVAAPAAERVACDCPEPEPRLLPAPSWSCAGSDPPELSPRSCWTEDGAFCVSSVLSG